MNTRRNPMTLKIMKRLRSYIFNNKAYNLLKYDTLYIYIIHATNDFGFSLWFTDIRVLIHTLHHITTAIKKLTISAGARFIIVAPFRSCRRVR